MTNLDNPELDGPDRCDVCGKWIGAGKRDKECSCPECPTCEEVGNLACYEGRGHMPKGNRAFHLRDLAEHIGAWEASEGAIAKRLFKDTRCGISFTVSPEDNSVSVCGYAEGSDAELEPVTLEFPFSLSEFSKAVRDVDEDGCKAWEEANK